MVELPPILCRKDVAQTSCYRCVINKIRDFDLPLFGGQFSSIPRPLRERAEFQVELLRNLEIRLRGDLSRRIEFNLSLTTSSHACKNPDASQMTAGFLRICGACVNFPVSLTIYRYLFIFGNLMLFREAIFQASP